MALYHFHVTQVKRSAGSSAIAAAAYRAGERLYSERYDEVNDYTHKGGVIHSEILLPDHAPREYLDRQTLWNAVEAAEKRPDAQLAYSFDIALQNELSPEENLQLARQFIVENFVSRGMICDLAFHDPDREPSGISNPHIHVLCPIRPLNPDGTWGVKQRSVPVLDDQGERVWDEKNHRWKVTSEDTTDWGHTETLEEWRKAWCELCNKKFAEKGLDVRIDHRSYLRQGVDLLPQIHEGPAVRAMEAKGIHTEKGDHNREIRAVNAMLKELGRKLNLLLGWIRSAREKFTQESTEEPDLMEFILRYIDLMNSGAQNYSRYGRQRAGITTLQDANKIRNYLLSTGIRTPSQMEAHLQELKASTDSLKAKINEKKERIRMLKEVIGQADIYRQTRPLAEKLNGMHFKKSREKFEQEHVPQLKQYRRARRILQENGMPEEYDSAVVRKWRKELDALEQERMGLSAELTPIWEEKNTLLHIRYCVNAAMNADTRTQTRSNTIEI